MNGSGLRPIGASAAAYTLLRGWARVIIRAQRHKRAALHSPRRVGAWALVNASDAHGVAIRYGRVFRHRFPEGARGRFNSNGKPSLWFVRSWCLPCLALLLALVGCSPAVETSGSGGGGITTTCDGAGGAPETTTTASETTETTTTAPAPETCTADADCDAPAYCCGGYCVTTNCPFQPDGGA